MKHLLRNILDPHSLSLQMTKLTRNRNYDDAVYYYKLPHPSNAPEWAYSEQDTTYETDFDEYTQNQTDEENEDIDRNNNPKKLSRDERHVSQEHQVGESSAHGEIRGAILQNEKALEEALRQSGNEYAPLTDEDYDNF